MKPTATLQRLTKAQGSTTSNRVPLIVSLAMAVVCTVFATEARAACFTRSARHPFATLESQFAGPGAAQRASDSDSPDAGDSIVGMWNAEYLIGDGPARYDQSFQQFHSDGTEIMVSNGLPPALGNVCVGVWQKTDRTVRLRHMTWNWDVDGNLTGTFIMVVTLRVDRRGDSFSGMWSADSYDLSNNIIPKLHAEGIVRATRVTVN